MLSFPQMGSYETLSEAAIMLSHAIPFLLPLIFVPLLGLAMVFGEWWIGGAALFAFLVAPIVDHITSHHLRNLDPTVPESSLFWHKLAQDNSAMRNELCVELLHLF